MRPAEAEGQRAAPTPTPTPTPFLSKTYQLVEDPAVDDVVSWNDDGSAFVVWRPAEFGRDLLPQYFKHSNFSSFVRQLNTYGFRKIAPDRWEFANDCFRRGEKRLLCDIQRRKVAHAAAIPVSPANSADEQVLSSGSSPGGAVGDLAVQNERLRRENARLLREVARMKGLCNDVLLLMSEYTAGRARGRAGVALAAEPATAPETMPPQRAAKEVTNTPAPSGGARLFGVDIGAKRLRTDDSGDRPDRTEIESEPLDAFSILEGQRHWLSLHTRVCKS